MISLMKLSLDLISNLCVRSPSTDGLISSSYFHSLYNVEAYCKLVWQLVVACWKPNSYEQFEFDTKTRSAVVDKAYWCCHDCFRSVVLYVYSVSSLRFLMDRKMKLKAGTTSAATAIFSEHAE